MNNKSYIPAGSAIVLLITLLIAPQTSTGRVFERWRSRGTISETMTRLGATELISGNITINDGNGNISVFGIGKPLTSAWPAIIRDNDTERPHIPSGTMAFAKIHGDNIINSLLGLALPDNKNSIIFVLQQTPRQSELSRNNDGKHRLNNLPFYANSKPFFFAGHDENRFKIEISRSTDAPEVIRMNMDSSLRGRGWLRISPAEQHNLPSLIAYGRENESCWLFIAPEEIRPGAKTTIAIIHKRKTYRSPVF